MSDSFWNGRRSPETIHLQCSGRARPRAPPEHCKCIVSGLLSQIRFGTVGPYFMQLKTTSKSMYRRSFCHKTFEVFCQNKFNALQHPTLRWFVCRRCVRRISIVRASRSPPRPRARLDWWSSFLQSWGSLESVVGQFSSAGANFQCLK